MASAAAAVLLLRGVPLLRAGVLRAAPLRCFATHPQPPASGSESNPTVSRSPKPPTPPSSNSWMEQPDYRQWKDRESQILQDIEPITFLTKDILHSNRYRDGERLTAEDEKEVVEKLLVYHPHSEDKIGCGLNSIMVDRHPQFRNSRCLFVIRTDGGWIDFSYQKCLRAYIRDKYPSHADRFIREHFKRS